MEKLAKLPLSYGAIYKILLDRRSLPEYVFSWLKHSGFGDAILIIQRGLSSTLPLIMVGAFVLMLRNFPVPQFRVLLSRVLGPEWLTVTEDIVAGSFGIAALAVLFSISGTMARHANQKHRDTFVCPILAGIVSLSCYFIIAPHDATMLRPLFSLDRGLLFSIVIAFSSCGLLLRLARIKTLQMPFKDTGHDPIIRSTLTVLPAGTATIAAFGIFKAVLVFSGLSDIHTLITHSFIPLVTHLGELGFNILYVFFSQLLWFLGTHGPNMLFAIEQNVLVPAGQANADAIAHGLQPVFIITKSFYDTFSSAGGSGSTLSLILAMFWKSKNTGNRKLCFFGMFPALFNVNEPLLFGLPLIFNPIYLIPFLLTPLLQSLAAYGATAMGILPYTAGTIPWTTPVLFSGYLSTGSLIGPLFQLALILLGALLYAPFVELDDSIQEEQGRQNMAALLKAASGCAPGPHGQKCMGLGGEQGRLAKTLAGDLATALKHGEQLYVVYQPQFNGTGDHIMGVEALLRWEHPTYGMIPPPITVALAEDSGNMDKLGMLVLSEACAHRAVWRKTVSEHMRIAVNLSPHQLHNTNLVHNVMAVLQKSELPPSLLELEISESSILDPTPTLMDTITRLQKLGIRLAIDDFGMGHTSLRCLKAIPLHTLKIDRSLTIGEPGNINDQIIRSIIDLGNTLRMTTIIEGVETSEQVERFRKLGCDFFQGFFFSRPVPAETLYALLKKTKTAAVQSLAG